MKFSYNWLQEFFQKKLPAPKKLAELLTMHSFEVESVKEVRSASGGSDFLLDIAILSNRMPDASSHLGVAREIAALLKSEIRNPCLAGRQAKSETISKSKIKNLKDSLKIEIENAELCPRYTALVIKGIKVGPSPKWLKEKLEVCGLNSINNVVDAGNYVMLEMGQPLHVFDFDKLGGKIIVRPAKKGEKIITLDNKKYELDSEILAISDSEKPVALAGIKGGKGPEVDSRTKNIALEAANFNFSSIRKTSKKLELKTDASLRFSAGLDPNLTEKAIGRLAQVIQDLAGGKIEGVIDAYPKKVVPAKIKLNFEKVRGLLGVDISDKEIKEILKRLELKEVAPPQGGATSKKNGFFEIPTIRRDLQIEEDLIEEVGRIYGYENIKAKHSLGELILPEENELLNFREKIRTYFAANGFSEVYNYSLSDQSELGFLPAGFQNVLLELKNPPKPESRFLRPSLLPRLFANASFNLRNFKNTRLPTRQVQIFEIGNVFHSFDRQEEKLAFVIAGDSADRAFLEIKGLASAFFESLGLTDFWLDTVPFENPPAGGPPAGGRSEVAMLKKIFHPFRAAEIKIGDKTLGVLGEVSSEITNPSAGGGIKTALVAAELDFKNLFDLSVKEREFKSISRYPAVIRDIAVLVPSEVRISQVLDLMEAAGGDFLEDVDLFDVYEGREIPEGKKNLAFRLVFQSYEKTLTDKEVKGFMEKIIREIEKNPDWEIRK